MIKVCGMRDADNIREVEALGIDMMGFIFYPRSRRYVGEVPAYMPQHCRRVGVFVNADRDTILRHVEAFGLDMVQLHGDESPAFCASLHGLSLIKAVHASALSEAYAYEGLVDYLLFETPCAGYGGSGEQFDWSLLAGYGGHTPFLLSGGIAPADASRVRAFRHPRFAGIDLNSRFEIAPGIKDAGSLRRFIAETVKQ